MASFLLVACAPPVTYEIHEKEKVIREQFVSTIPPEPKTDLFRFNQPAGYANVVWVVDNSFNAETLFDSDRRFEGKSQFQFGYEKVMKQVTDVGNQSLFRFVHFQNQVVLMPSKRTPANPMKTRKPADKHLADLFASPGGLLIASSRLGGEKREAGILAPFPALAHGLSNDAYTEWGANNPNLFIIFVITKRGTSITSPQEKEALAQALAKSERAVSTVNVMHLVSDESCRWERPAGFLAESTRVGWSVTEGNLCDGPEKWGIRVASWILSRQSQMRLRYTPDERFDMIVKVGEEKLGLSEYVYERESNSIRLMKTGYTEGLPVTVNYIKNSPLPLPPTAGGK